MNLVDYTWEGLLNTQDGGLVPMLEGILHWQTGPLIHNGRFGDVGTSDVDTEIFCIQPIRISGVEVCQIYYHSILGITKSIERKIPE